VEVGHVCELFIEPVELGSLLHCPPLVMYRRQRHSKCLERLPPSSHLEKMKYKKSLFQEVVNATGAW